MVRAKEKLLESGMVCGCEMSVCIPYSFQTIKRRKEANSKILKYHYQPPSKIHNVPSISSCSCVFTPLHLLARFVPLELMQYSNKSDWAQQSINLYIQFNNKLKMTEEEKVHLIHTHQRNENNNKWMGGKRRDHDCPCNYVSSSSQHIEPSQREKTGELCRSSRRNGKTPKLSVISLTGSYFIRGRVEFLYQLHSKYGWWYGGMVSVKTCHSEEDHDDDAFS